ncbi:YybH family protein [Inhella crocodyli]|nr:nuclear transport factor 2 family protein [Inhella crocodyli]
MVRRKAPLAVLMASPDEIEAQFYEALQAGDLDRLMSLWVNDELVRLIHPGGVPVVGATAIRASFGALFARGPVAVQAAEVTRLTTDQLAVHQVRERVLVPGPAEGGGAQIAWVMATNVYMRTAEGWRMVLHHASPGTADESPSVHSGDANVLH